MKECYSLRCGLIRDSIGVVGEEWRFCVEAQGGCCDDYFIISVIWLDRRSEGPETIICSGSDEDGLSVFGNGYLVVLEGGGAVVVA